MKLLIVTTVAEYQKEVLQLFKKSGIDAFSASEIDGYKNSNSLIAMQSWFPAEHSGNESLMLFSFTDMEKIEKFFILATEFNENIETNNKIRAVVVPIEKNL